MSQGVDLKGFMPKGRRALAGLAAVLLVAGATAAPPKPVQAHPHIWIDVSVDLRFEGDTLKGMRVTWLFDEYYSAFALEERDTNGNGRLEPEELAVLENGHHGLKEYSYFTHLKIGDVVPESLRVEAVENFKVEWKGDRLQYAFDVPLPEGLDPAKTRFQVGFYDETYYIDLNLGAMSKPRVAGNWPGSCGAVMVEDQENPIYFGMVNPLYLQIGCDVS